MAGAQMALPIERRNGASVARPTPAPVEAPALAPMVDAELDVMEVPLWVRRVTTAAVIAVAGVAAVASYESPYVKRWVG